MKIKMITTAAGPQGVFPAGKTVEVSGDLARAFIAGGYALALVAEKPAPAPEIAVIAPPERAIMPPGKAKGK